MDVSSTCPSAAYYQVTLSSGAPTSRSTGKTMGRARTATDGAQALGIKVSRTHLLALLPEEPTRARGSAEQTKPEEREKMGPKVWLAWARKEHPRQRNEEPTDYIRRLHALMQEADVTEVWTFENLAAPLLRSSQNRSDKLRKSAQNSARCLSCCGFMRAQNCATAHLICALFRRHHRRHENAISAISISAHGLARR